jgi:phosphonate metabolism protein (transferase hexapeptide repeat family)
MKLLGPIPLINDSAQVRNCTFGAYVEVGARAQLLEVSMDDYSYVVNDTDIAYASIGKFCSIASHVRINPGDHPMERASQSHLTYRASSYFEGASDEADLFARRRSKLVTIGHDVWIGHGAIILSGRTIGTGAVIGAGAIVTKDVPDYSIVVGNPARVLRMRFSESAITALRNLQWWDWPHDKLRVALEDFRSLQVDEFCDKYAAR